MNCIINHLFALFKKYSWIWAHDSVDLTRRDQAVLSKCAVLKILLKGIFGLNAKSILSKRLSRFKKLTQGFHQSHSFVLCTIQNKHC